MKTRPPPMPRLTLRCFWKPKPSSPRTERHRVRAAGTSWGQQLLNAGLEIVPDLPG